MRFRGRAYTKFISLWKRAISRAPVPVQLSAQVRGTARLIAGRLVSEDGPTPAFEVKVSDGRPAADQY